MDCRVNADFTSPSGNTTTVSAFWDGGTTWRIRFSPDETGQWTWSTRSSSHDTGLDGRSGTFECVPYEGSNMLYKHGLLRVSDDGYRITHADGTSFFWLGDTAWNGVIRGNDGNWQQYLELRARQKFTAIQFVSSNWRGNALDEAGEPSWNSERSAVRINPSFFQRLDRRVAMINESGLLAVPVLLWSLLETDPGYYLPEEDAVRLASYIVSRYDAYQVVWLLGGDGNYPQMGIDRWKRIGRDVFRSGHDRLATLHPCGLNWVGSEFRGENWYSMIGYQSGHGDGDSDLRWLVEGPPATSWNGQPPLPVINLEPNYEIAYGYQNRTTFSDYHVRRAAYWSLLVSPTAGVTYGHDAVWNWNFETGQSEGHGDWHDGAVPPWYTGLETPGVRSMSVLRDIFACLDWVTMMPCPSMLREQPGNAIPERFVAAGRTADGTAVVYAPCGGTVYLAPEAAVAGPLRFIDPRTGEDTLAGELVGNTVDFPDERDWLAVCGKGWNA